MALLRLLVLVAGAFSKQVTPEQTPTVGPWTTVSLQFESLQGGLGPDAMDLEAKENDT